MELYTYTTNAQLLNILRFSSDLVLISYNVQYTTDTANRRREYNWHITALSFCLHSVKCNIYEYFFYILLTVHLNIFYLNINQLDALNFIMSLFHASTCFEHMCSSSGVLPSISKYKFSLLNIRNFCGPPNVDGCTSWFFQSIHFIL